MQYCRYTEVVRNCIGKHSIEEIEITQQERLYEMKKRNYLSNEDVKIKDIAKEIDETVVFCGAGISRNSGIPIVSEFIPHSLLTLCSPDGKRIENIETNKEIKILRKKLKITNNIINKIIYKFPFEAFMSIMCRKELESDKEPLYEIFELGAPNTNHNFLACLMNYELIKIIITTNFDRLLESAMKRAEAKNYQVLYLTEQFNKIEWENGKKKIIHIHGSIYDKKDLASTIESVANRKMAEQRGQIIDYVFSGGPHKNILILGYSCSDVFDLIPRIQGLNDKSKKVIFIDHDSKNKQTDKDKVHNAFKDFKLFERLNYNTDTFIEKLWVELEPRINKKYEKLEKNNILWKRKIFQWGLWHGSIRKYEILGKIFYSVSEYRTAVRYFKLMLNKIKRDHSFKCKILVNLGSAYHNLGKYNKALKYYVQALDIVRDNEDWALEGELLGKIGNIYSEQNHTRSAIDCYDQALNRERNFGRKENEVKWLGFIAGESGDHHSAIEYFKRALKISQNNGDKLIEGSWLGHIGDSYCKLGDYLSAINNYKDALEIVQQIADERGEGTWLSHLGNAYCRSGDYLSAIENYECAITIAGRITDINTKEYCFAGLGEANQGLGYYYKAIKYNKKALKIARYKEDAMTEGYCLIGLGVAYQSLAYYNTAVKYNKKALALLRKWFGKDDPYARKAEYNLKMAIEKRNSNIFYRLDFIDFIPFLISLFRKSVN